MLVAPKVELAPGGSNFFSCLTDCFFCNRETAPCAVSKPVVTLGRLDGTNLHRTDFVNMLGKNDIILRHFKILISFSRAIELSSRITLGLIPFINQQFCTPSCCLNQLRFNFSALLVLVVWSTVFHNNGYIFIAATMDHQCLTPESGNITSNGSTIGEVTYISGRKCLNKATLTPVSFTELFSPNSSRTTLYGLVRHLWTSNHLRQSKPNL